MGLPLHPAERAVTAAPVGSAPPSLDELARFFALSEELCVVLDGELRIRAWNPAAAAFADGAIAAETALFHAADREAATAAIESARRERRLVEIEARAPGGGGERWLTWRIAADGVGTRVLLVGRDVTARRTSESELANARELARQSSRLRSAFLDNLSHEIRTPLNVIVGYTSLIEERLPENADAPPAVVLQGIRRASDRLTATIDAILDLSKLEAGAYRFRAARIDLLFFVERTIEPYRVLALEKGLELSWSIRAPESAIEFDEHALATAFASLVDNAIKFTDRGRVEVRLRRDDGGVLVLEVSDTGIGIAPETRECMFEPFAQGDCGLARRFEGTGIGLALAKRLLEEGGAGLEVDSEPGRGATFRIRFFGVKEIRALGAAREDIAMDNAIDSDKRPTVLIVEDDVDTQVYMRAVLRRHYDVLVAASGEEFRRQLAERGDEVTIVLMDLSLRGSEDGLALTRELRTSERFRALPVIATTAHAFAEDRARVLEAGCNAYLAKPFNHRELFAAMSGLLGS